MISIYVYCSYNFSPVGFQLGVVRYKDYNEWEKKTYIIPETASDTSDYIRCLFEEGLVQRAYGYINEKNHYLFLQKKLSVKSAVDESIILYINIAFEFDDFSQFVALKQNFGDLTAEEQAKKCAPFIVPDKDLKRFALKLDVRQLIDFIKQMTHSVDFVDEQEEYKEQFFIDSISSNDYTQKISNMFWGEFSKIGEKQYCYPAKEKFTQKKTILFVVMILIVILLAYLFLD